MSSDSKPKLYEFVGSCWSNAPKLAIPETGYKDGDIEFISINLAEGANFNPDYLKINHKGKVPCMQADGKTFDDSTTIVSELIRRAPHPPRVSAHTSTSIIEEIHLAAHDPNDTMIYALDDKDRQDKVNGLPKAFLQARQNAMDKYIEETTSEEMFAYMKITRMFNGPLLDFFAGNPDEATKQAHYAKAAQLWKSVGIVIRGVLTQALKKDGGPFAAGDNPGEADFHIIAWLARTVTNTGIAPGSPASAVIPKLQEYTGGHSIDPVVGKYWDAWLGRDSFKDNNIH